MPTEPVNYPDPFRSIVRRAAHLRHELLPYNYTLAWQNSQTGVPLARPLNFGEAPAANAPTANDAFLWGDNLLVAPVLNPGQTQRTVVLPPGGHWLDVNTLREYPGGSLATVPAPLARLPLLVRAGTLLATQPYRPSTAQGQLDTLRIRYFPAQGSTGIPAVVYDDNGRTPNAYASGQYKLLHFEEVPTGAADYTFIATATGPGYAEMPPRRALEYTIERVAQVPGMVTYQAQTLPLAPDEAAYLAADSAAYFDAGAQQLRVHFGWRHQRAVVRVFGTALAVGGAAGPAAAPLALAAAYPNPFADDITFGYDVARPGRYALRVFSVTGQLVATLPLLAERPGPGALRWDGRGANGQPLSAGVYIVELNGQRQRVSKL